MKRTFHDAALGNLADLAASLDLRMAVTGQALAAQEAGRPQPQTTVEADGGPFIRHAQAGRLPIYTISGTAMGGQITQALVARPGYYRNFRIQHTFVTGGTITNSTALAADAPYNVGSQIQFKDSFGTPIFTGDMYSIALLVNMYSGGFGIDNGTNLPSNLPSWTALSYSTGAGQFSYALPLEFAKAYGVVSGANASMVPQLQINFNPGATVLTNGTANFPTITTTVESDIYWLPEGVDIEPPGLGTTRQWQVSSLNPTLPASSSARLQFSRLGGYLDTIIVIARDSTGARTDGFWPTNGRLQFIVDGIPLIDSNYNNILDDMWIQFGAVARPTGVLAISRKTSLNQKSNGLLDTGESYLSTSPATLLELNIISSGAGSNGPATLTGLVGQVVPSGALIQGLPEA